MAALAVVVVAITGFIHVLGIVSTILLVVGLFLVGAAFQNGARRSSGRTLARHQRGARGLGDRTGLSRPQHAWFVRARTAGWLRWR